MGTGVSSLGRADFTFENRLSCINIAPGRPGELASPVAVVSVVAVSCLMVFGAVAFVNNFWVASPAPGPNTQSDTEVQTLSPAGDVTGTWSGPAVLQDKDGPGCGYAGPTTLTLSQTGNDVQGTLLIDPLSVTNQPSSQLCDMASHIEGPVYGTVSSSGISLRDDFGDTFTGSYTTDTMKLNGVSGTGSEPAAPGASCVSGCGWTGTFTLTRTSTQTTTTTGPETVTITTTASSTFYPATSQTGLPGSRITLRQANYYFSSGSDCSSGCNEWLSFDIGRTFSLVGGVQGRDQFVENWWQDGPYGSIPSCSVASVSWEWVSGTHINSTVLSLVTSPPSATIPNGGSQNFTSTFTLLQPTFYGQPIDSVIDLVYQGSCA